MYNSGMARETPVIYEQGLGTGREVMVINGVDNLRPAEPIFAAHHFPLELAARFIGGDLGNLTIKSGPTSRSWPTEEPVEAFVERIVKTTSGLVEYSLCHFDRIIGNTDPRGWKSLDLTARATLRGRKFPPLEIISVSGGRGTLLILDEVTGEGQSLQGSSSGQLVTLEPGVIVVMTAGVGNTFSDIGKEGLDFAYISRPPYDKVRVIPVEPQVEII